MKHAIQRITLLVLALTGLSTLGSLEPPDKFRDDEETRFDARRPGPGTKPDLIYDNTVSREFMVQRQSAPDGPVNNAVSREFSVQRIVPQDEAFTNAVSREFSVRRFMQEVAAFTNAVSREFSVQISIPIAFEFTNAVSREFSVRRLQSTAMPFTNAVAREFSTNHLAADLQVTGLTPPPSVVAGTTVEVAWVVTNTGHLPASGPWTETVYGSADGTVGSDIVLANFIFAGTLDPGESVLRVEDVSVPADLPPGNYYAVACTDTQSQIPEILESNNCAIAPVCVDCQAPDLEVVSVVEPTFGFDGQPLEVTWTVANNGRGSVETPWVDAVYLSDDLFTGGDTLLGTFSSPGPLAALEDYTRTDDLTLPPGTEGVFYIIVITDSQNSVSEPGAEGNNDLVAPASTTVFPPELPDLEVTDITAPAAAVTGQIITLAWKVANTNSTGTAAGSWSDGVYASADDQLDPEPGGSDQLLHTETFTGALAPGNFYLKTAQLTLPEEAGVYRLFVATDALSDVTETDDDNNASFATVDVAAPTYTATVAADVDVAPSDTVVHFTGQALAADKSGPAANVPVSIRVHSQGTRRVFNAMSNDAGDFSYPFDPLPGEAGFYRIYADHPDVMENESQPQDTFILHNLRAEPAQVIAELETGIALAGQVLLRNLADVPVSGITAVIEGVPPNLDVQLNVPDSLPALGTAPLAYTLTAANKSVDEGQVVVRIHLPIGGSNVEVETLVLSFFIEPEAPVLVATPSELNNSVLRGAQTIVEFQVTNEGGAPASDVQVVLPANPPSWLNLLTPAQIGDIAPGASADVQLALLPSASLQLGEYTGQIGIQSARTSILVPFVFRAVSEEKGDLSVIVEDEATYYTPGADPFNGGGPLVQNATITVEDPYDGTVVATASSGSTGTALVEDLPEGYYTLKVTEDFEEVDCPAGIEPPCPVDHGSFSTTILVHADTVTEVRAFLAAQTVTYNWTVLPTEVQDVYVVTLEADFVTWVPAPVVTLEPELVELTLEPGETMQLDMTITNHGIIAAQNAHLVFGSFADYEFTPLITDIGTLAAQTTLVVPLTITRFSAAGPGSNDCAEFHGQLIWELICQIPRVYSVGIKFFKEGCSGGATGGGGGPGGGGGGSSSGPGLCCGGPGGTTYVEPIFCEVPPVPPLEGPPCVNPCVCEYPPGASAGDPVLLYSGEFYLTEEDVRIPGRGMDFVWTRTYRSRIGPDTAQGNGWDFSYNVDLMPTGTNLFLRNGLGRNDTYKPQIDGKWGRNEFFHDINKNPDTTYTLTLADKSTWTFHSLISSFDASKLVKMTDRNGNSITLHYDPLNRLDRITDTLDRDILIAYNIDGLIESVTDFAGRQVRYEYYQDGDAGGSFGDLKSVTTPAVTGTPNGNDFPLGKTKVYTYSKGFAKGSYSQFLNHNLLTITDAKGQTYLQNEYYDEENFNNINFDRVRRQTWGDDGDVIDFFYVALVPSVANHQAATRAIVNDRVGNVTEHDFDLLNRRVRLREWTGRADPDQPTTIGSNRPANKLRPGDPDFFETVYEWNQDSQLVREIRPNGNITENVYELDLNPDASRRTRGNLRMVRRLPGTHSPAGDQAEIVEQFEYGDEAGCGTCGFSFVTRHVNARNHETLHTYDEHGNRIHTQERDPAVVEDFEYNDFGQMTAHTLPDSGSGHRRRDEFTYHDTGPQRGYLHQEVVDAGDFNITTAYEYDPVGNPVRVVDPRGNDTLYEYNALNQVVREQSRAVDLAAGPTRYETLTWYDANDNVVRVDVQNVDDQGAVGSNAHFTTINEYEILNQLTRTCQELGDADVGSSVVDCAGLGADFIVTEYDYDANRNRTLVRFGQATSGADPFNAVATVYDERNLLFQETRAPGHPSLMGGPGAPATDGTSVQSTMQYDYDRNRNLKLMTHGLEAADGAHVTTNFYDAYDRQVEMVDPMGNRTVYHYDPNGNRAKELVFGELVDEPGSTFNVRLSETTSVFDVMDRLERSDVAFFDTQTGQPIGDGLAITQTIWTPDSQVQQAINDNNHATTTAYDTANRQRIVTDAKGNTVTYNYDANGNVTSNVEVEKSDLGTPDEVFTTTFVHDALDRQTAVIDNIGNTNRSYFDSRSNRTRTLDALDHEILYQYDGLSRLVRTIRDMDGSGLNSANSSAVAGDPDLGTENIVTEQGWDASSRLVTQTDDNDNTTTYVYDSLNRKISEAYADTTHKDFVFDPHDSNIFWTDGNHNLVTQTFDDADRLIRRDVIPGPGVSDDTTFEVYKYDGLARLIWAEDDDTKVTRQYDSLSHVTTEIQELHDDSAQPWPPAVVTSVFDGVGNMTQLGYPSGRLVTTTYDELERKKTISDQDGPIAEYFYVGPGRVQRRDYGNGTRAEWTYDGITGVPNPGNDFGVKNIVRTRNTVVGVTCSSDADCPAGNSCEASTGTCIIDDRTYTWDKIGNKTQRMDVRPGGPQLTHDYSHDNAYRLVHSTQAGPGAPIDTIHYMLDGVGNRMEVTGGPDAGAYGLDDTLPDPGDRQMNQYTSVSGEHWSYDDSGNLASTGSFDFQYDYLSRLVDTSRHRTGLLSSLSYDALDRRVLSFAQRSIFTEFEEIAEVNESRSLSVEYVRGLDCDEILNSNLPGGEVFLFADDMLSIVVPISPAGETLERYDYSDFGIPIISDASSTGTRLLTSLIGNTYFFVGRPYDNVTGLAYHRLRYYLAQVGRFSTRDSIGMWGDILNCGNATLYVNANPFTWVDTDGDEHKPQGTGSWSKNKQRHQQGTARNQAGRNNKFRWPRVRPNNWTGSWPPNKTIFKIPPGGQGGAISPGLLRFLGKIGGVVGAMVLFPDPAC